MPAPKHWIDCPPFASDVIGNTFVVFKTPYDYRLGGFGLRPKSVEPHTTQVIFDHLNNLQLNVGLWIDLSNTDKYFSPTSIKEKGVEYVKIRCVGQEAPSKRLIAEFQHICRKFLAAHPNSLIAVHCTHGFNRTGYMIVHYLVSTRSYSVTDAVEEFANKRSPGIYRERLLISLYNRLKTSATEVPRPPTIPRWARDPSHNSRQNNRHGQSSFVL